MKYPVSKVKSAIYTALNGNISVANMRGAGTVSVSIYDNLIPKGATYPYIVMQNFRTIEVGTKTSFSTEVTGVLNVVTASDGDYGGGKQSEDIANEITQIINSDAPLSVTGHKNFVTVLESVDERIDNDGTNLLFRKLLRYRFELEQN